MIAKRLTQIAGKGSVARLAATRFGIILRYKLGSDAPERLARRVVEEISKPVQLAALALQVGVSVGVSAGMPRWHLRQRYGQTRRNSRGDRSAASGHGDVMGQV
jgi:GGDEF domain-containing protein